MQALEFFKICEFINDILFSVLFPSQFFMQH